MIDIHVSLSLAKDFLTWPRELLSVHSTESYDFLLLVYAIVILSGYPSLRYITTRAIAWAWMVDEGTRFQFNGLGFGLQELLNSKTKTNFQRLYFKLSRILITSE